MKYFIEHNILRLEWASDIFKNQDSRSKNQEFIFKIEESTFHMILLQCRQYYEIRVWNALSFSNTKGYFFIKHQAQSNFKS